MERRLWISAFYVVLSTFLILWILGGTKAIAQNKYIQQEYYAKDIGLLVDTSFTADGNVEIKYPGKEGFSYKIGDGKIEIREKSKTQK